MHQPTTEDERKKVLFICGREISYSRNTVMLRAFSQHSRVVNISSNSKNYLARYFSIVFRFIFLRENYDIIFIGFYGHPLVFLIRLFTKKPIIFDAFVSTYQTLCFDRKIFSPKSFFGRIAYLIDKTTCSLANLVILDTNAHINYFVKTFNLPREKFKRIFVGADESLFFPRKLKLNNSPKIVLFYGEYQALHGIQHIVKAAKLLEKDNIRFKIIGKGRKRAEIDELAKSLKIKNIEFVDWVPYTNLPREISRANLCIGGHLGTTEKARLVIAGKTFQSIAMKKPTIVALNDANQELFPDTGKIFFVKPGNERELSRKIKDILSNPQISKKIENEQFEAYILNASNEVISSQVGQILENTIKFK